MPPTHPRRRTGLARCGLATLLIGAIPACAGTTGEIPAEPSAEAIASLISRLGDADFQRREAASADLKAIGPAAVDALLAAAELDRDLEVALRARWLVDAIPLGMPHDPPEVTQFLESYKQRDFSQRVRVMHRLLRVDDDAGIEALARIIRLERAPEGSRLAAALLVREWDAANRWWSALAPHAAAGLGSSQRPAAAFTVVSRPPSSMPGVWRSTCTIQALSLPLDHETRVFIERRPGGGRRRAARRQA